MTSPTKFYHEIQIILYVCSCDQSLITEAFLWKKLSQPQFCKDLTKKPTFFEEWSWFKFNNLELGLGKNLKFPSRVAKRLKLKLRRFWGLIPTFVEVTRGKTGRGDFLDTPILNRVNVFSKKVWYAYPVPHIVHTKKVVSYSLVPGQQHL